MRVARMSFFRNDTINAMRNEHGVWAEADYFFMIKGYWIPWEQQKIYYPGSSMLQSYCFSWKWEKNTFFSSWLDGEVYE